MSQHPTAGGNAVAPALEVTPTKKRKKRAFPECEEIKITKPKAKNMCHTGKGMRIAKTSVKAMSQLADPAGMLQCVFHRISAFLYGRNIS